MVDAFSRLLQDDPLESPPEGEPETMSTEELQMRLKACTREYARLTLRRERVEKTIASLKARCPHPSVDSFNNHGYERIRQCRICGHSW